jgi:thioredoxin:protein disulfide reductase
MNKARFLLLASAILLAISAANATETPGKSLGNLLSNLSGSTGETEILDTDQAFVLSVTIADAHHLRLKWEIAEGYYLYRDKFSFSTNHTQVILQPYVLPAGEVKQDPNFGNVEVFHRTVDVRLPLVRHTARETDMDLAVIYQGCKEDTVCYPPVTKTVSLSLPAAENETASAKKGTGTYSDSIVISSQDKISNSLKNDSLLVNMLIFFGFGLLLAFTPCIFPMIPILSGIIVGQGNKITTSYAFLLSLVYVIAMAFTYALLGVIAGSFQINLQAASQNTWVITAFSLVFVLLALSMFGFYELQLPASWQNHLSNLGKNQRQGSHIGAGVMGVLSAIVVGPCVAPPLAGALIYISHTGNAILGGSALFSMGLGMGVPLLLIGTSAGRFLPHSGSWMTTIKNIFGIILLGVAIWFMGRVLPGPLTLILWGILLVVSAVFMGALNISDQGTGWHKLWQGLGIVLLVYGLTLIVGAAGGRDDVFRPLQYIDGQSAKVSNLNFTAVRSIQDLDDILAKAEWDQKTVMLDFYADWCPTCKEMEKYTFPDPGVQAALGEMMLLKADVTENNNSDQALMRRFDIIGPPAILFFVRGKERREYRLIGFINKENFVEHIRIVNSL